jgi:hypothetical protein
LQLISRAAKLMKLKTFLSVCADAPLPENDPRANFCWYCWFYITRQDYPQVTPVTGNQ